MVHSSCLSALISRVGKQQKPVRLPVLPGADVSDAADHARAIDSLGAVQFPTLVPFGQDREVGELPVRVEIGDGSGSVFLRAADHLHDTGDRGDSRPGRRSPGLGRQVDRSRRGPSQITARG